MDLCAIAVPSGFTPTGLPFGISFLAPAYPEPLLSALGAAFHARADLQLGATTRSVSDLLPLSIPSQSARFTALCLRRPHVGLGTQSRAYLPRGALAQALTHGLVLPAVCAAIHDPTAPGSHPDGAGAWHRGWKCGMCRGIRSGDSSPAFPRRSPSVASSSRTENRSRGFFVKRTPLLPDSTSVLRAAGAVTWPSARPPRTGRHSRTVWALLVKGLDAAMSIISTQWRGVRVA